MVVSRPSGWPCQSDAALVCRFVVVRMVPSVGGTDTWPGGWEQTDETKAKSVTKVKNWTLYEMFT